MSNILETKKQLDGLVNVFFSELLALAGDDEKLIPLCWEYRWRIQGETEKVVNKFVTRQRGYEANTHEAA